MRKLRLYFWQNNLNPAHLIGLLGFLLLSFTLYLYPLAQLFWIPNQFGQDLLKMLEAIFQNDSILRSTGNTFWTAAGVVLFSQLISLPAAWFVMRTELPGAAFFRSCLSLPYAIPPFFGAIAWIFLANPSNGLFNQLLGRSFLNIYSMPGLIFIETSFLFTFAFISYCSVYEQMDASLEEAARVAGAGPLRLFFRIHLPLLKTSVINSSLLIALAVFASFGVPAMIGGPGGFKVLTTEIFFLQKMGTESGLIRSIGVSNFLLILTVIFVLSVQFLFKPQRLAIVGGKSSRPSLIDLARTQRWLAVLFLVMVAIVFFFLPMGSLFFSALSKAQGVMGIENLTFDNVIRVVTQSEELGRAVYNSILISVSVAALATLISFLMSVFFYYSHHRGNGWIQLLLALPNSTPGTVISIALILAFSRTFFGLDFSIYNTIWIFILAYLMKFTNQSFKPVYDQAQRIHPSLIESAATSGAGPFRTLLKIWLPLLRPALFASVFFVLMPSLCELTISILLTGPGLETIGTMIYQLQEYSDNYGGGAAVLASLVLVTILVMNLTLKILSKGRYGL
jgi:iron(III) transport system permease protein